MASATPPPIPRVYIAGRYTAPTLAEREENTLLAGNFGAEVARLGAYPVVPHLVGFHVAERRSVERPYEWWIEVTAAELLTCQACFLVPNWRQSSGARSERELALDQGIPVFDALPALRTWLRERGIDG